MLFYKLMGLPMEHNIIAAGLFLWYSCRRFVTAGVSPAEGRAEMEVYYETAGINDV